MDLKLATLKGHESIGPAAAASAGPSPSASPSVTAESIRLDLAAAWGEMGAAWGVTPAIARVQAYLMARQEPLTEREVREALGLSHRAASLALSTSLDFDQVLDGLLLQVEQIVPFDAGSGAFSATSSGNAASRVVTVSVLPPLRFT